MVDTTAYQTSTARGAAVRLAQLALLAPPSTARPDWQPTRGAKMTYRRGACHQCGGNLLFTPGAWWVCVKCGDTRQEEVWNGRE